MTNNLPIPVKGKNSLFLLVRIDSEGMPARNQRRRSRAAGADKADGELITCRVSAPIT